MPITEILNGAPVWAYVLLVVLIALGVRRLKARDVPVFVAIIPVAAFFIWSVFGAVSFAAIAGGVFAAAAWIGGAAIGAASAKLLPDARGVRLPGGRVHLPKSWIPLLLYMVVFVVRFGCGAWAAINPAQAVLATGVGVAVSAAMTARLAMSVRFWVPSETPAS
jgi:hypothetical protein